MHRQIQSSIFNHLKVFKNQKCPFINFFSIGEAPEYQPQPGTHGGGGWPLGKDPIVKEAVGLLPQDFVPVSVFPPYADGQLKGQYRATALIFEEKPNCNPDHKHYLSRKRRGILQNWRDSWQRFLSKISSTFLRIKR